MVKDESPNELGPGHQEEESVLDEEEREDRLDYLASNLSHIPRKFIGSIKSTLRHWNCRQVARRISVYGK